MHHEYWVNTVVSVMLYTKLINSRLLPEYRYIVGSEGPNVSVLGTLTLTLAKNTVKT